MVHEAEVSLNGQTGGIHFTGKVFGMEATFDDILGSHDDVLAFNDRSAIHQFLILILNSDS
jgi:hypothetical protein